MCRQAGWGRGFPKSFPRLRGEAPRGIRSPLPSGGILASKASQGISPTLKSGDMWGFVVFHHATISPASANVAGLALTSPKNLSILPLVCG
ncbi:MAG: hypothetical protein EB824_06185 [Thaumarchaeota archaeon S15]|nr:MAG: hypothetical protein EB824_06185 [Thaumarchaeota archaeon S15]RNJ73988.1 MAG: hypothetical protein EB833_01615 [Thaumarchaeota archaeon S13]